MKILFISDNFPPETNAPACRTFGHCREWVKLGHEVTVITSFPNFPEGKVFTGYNNSWRKKIEYREGIKVVRVKSYITENRGFIKRTLDFLSFAVSASLAGLWEKPDRVVATSPQFFVAFTGLFLSKVKDVKLILEIRDIWPESIKAVGAINQGTIFSVLEFLERKVYQYSDEIIVVTRSFKQDLMEKGVAEEKISVVYNGIDNVFDYSAIQKSPNAFLGMFKHKFVVSYFGTFGMAHNLSTIVECARQIKDDNSILFVLAGSGSDRVRLISLVEKYQLDNLLILPKIPRKDIASLLYASDIQIVPLKDTPLFRTVIPSKIFESMAMRVPVIMSMPRGEAVDMVEELGVGIYCPPEDSTALLQKVLSLKNDKHLLDIMRKKCATVEGKFRRIASAKLMLKVVLNN